VLQVFFKNHDLKIMGKFFLTNQHWNFLKLISQNVLVFWNTRGSNLYGNVQWALMGDKTMATKV
jgi:hypothetical protein